MANPFGRTLRTSSFTALTFRLPSGECRLSLPVGVQQFEKVAQAGGQLLRVEFLAPHPAEFEGRGVVVSAFLLTFDLGGIAVRNLPQSRGIAVEAVTTREDAPADLRRVLLAAEAGGIRARPEPADA